MRVVIAEDAVLLREGLVRLLTEQGMEIVDAVGDGESLIVSTAEHRPDIVIADVRWNARHTNPAARAYLGIDPGVEGYDVLERLGAFDLSLSPSDLRKGPRANHEFLAASRDPRRPLVLAVKHFRAPFGASAEPVLVLRMRDATREHLEAEAQRVLQHHR